MRSGPVLFDSSTTAGCYSVRQTCGKPLLSLLYTSFFIVHPINRFITVIDVYFTAPNYALKMAVSRFLINSLSPICFTNKDKSWQINKSLNDKCLKLPNL